MKWKIGWLALPFALWLPAGWQSVAAEPPDTGISGVYEVMVGVADAGPVLEYFSQFGFAEVASADVPAERAAEIYGVDSALRSIRLQNGPVDAHGLLRVLEWATPLGSGVGFAPPQTVGTRMAVMRTSDIYRIADVFADLRDGAGESWLLAGPVYDDLYNATQGTPSIVNRRVGVREMAVYGQWFNHVFFQRYGYTIPGYGVIGGHSPLGTSEFTHHDFVVAGDLGEVTDYYESVFGFVSGKRPGHQRRVAGRASGRLPNGAGAFPLVSRFPFPRTTSAASSSSSRWRGCTWRTTVPRGSGRASWASLCTPCGHHGSNRCMASPWRAD